MTCPICGGDTKVINSRDRVDYVYRRRKCVICGHLFTTEETEKVKKYDKNRKYRDIRVASGDKGNAKPA